MSEKEKIFHKPLDSIFSKPPEAYSFAEKKSFVSFDSPPSLTDTVDSVVVLGTSKTIDRIGYDLRVGQAVTVASAFPQSEVIFTGKEVYGDRALAHETGANYIESAVMATDAVGMGLAHERIKLETKSLNARENIVFAEKVIHPESTGVIYVCSGYLGKRVDLYLKKMVKNKEIAQRNHFVVDADVRREKAGFQASSNQVEYERMLWRVDYEWSRIVKYRQSGDL